MGRIIGYQTGKTKYGAFGCNTGIYNINPSAGNSFQFSLPYFVGWFSSRHAKILKNMLCCNLKLVTKLALLKIYATY